MVKLGIVKSEEQFYQIFLEKWNEYLHKIKIGQKLKEAIGHNLYDIFYGRYRQEEQEILSRYIELADREEFADILDAVERFLYFDSRKKETGHGDEDDSVIGRR